MRPRALATTVALAVLLTIASPAGAQEYQPTVGQEGKDVVWVPTPPELVTAMLDMAKVGPNDYVIDLGSGDGRIVIAAAKRGARAMGIEYNPDMVVLSKQNAEKEGVSGKTSFMRADIFETDFRSATVVTMYLLPGLNLRLRPQLLDLKPGTRIVSHAFSMDDWEADETSTAEERTAYLWIVPAKVEGTWTWGAGQGAGELNLKQTFQKIEGNLSLEGKTLPLQNAKLNGDRISFSVTDGGTTPREFSGRVDGNVLKGTIHSGAAAEVAWTAQHRAGQ
jgi:SAM-dependent methyltransferase